MTEHRTVWVAYTNSDCTEGRGWDQPIAICEIEATAIRLARKMYVQGSDGPVRSMELMRNDSKWYIPTTAVTIVPPSTQDEINQNLIDQKRAAIKKAKALGLTDAEIKALND